MVRAMGDGILRLKYYEIPRRCIEIIDYGFIDYLLAKSTTRLHSRKIGRSHKR